MDDPGLGLGRRDDIPGARDYTGAPRRPVRHHTAMSRLLPRGLARPAPAIHCCRSSEAAVARRSATTSNRLTADGDDARLSEHTIRAADRLYFKVAVPCVNVQRGLEPAPRRHSNLRQRRWFATGYNSPLRD